MKRQHPPARTHLVGLVLALAAVLAACSSGGGDEPVIVKPEALALMVDSLGRPVPETQFGRGDAQAAGADGVAFDAAAIANAQVTLTDGAGITRTTTTDADGYFRFDIKALQPPFALKVRRADASEWRSASAEAPRARAFVTLNASGLTDKAVGSLAAPPSAAALDAAKARLRTALAVPLANAGLDAASYDPVTTALPAAGGHAALLQSLVFQRAADASLVVVATVAGRHGGFADGAAATALFNLPGGLALDDAGTVYVADSGNHRIRKISRSGVVSTVAGNGAPSHGNGPGASAGFKSPNSVAVDSAGNLYVADTGNHLVRKVTPEGVVSTLAGSGVAGYADGAGAVALFNAPWSIAIDRDGNLLVSDSGNDSVRKVTPAGTVTTLAGSGPVSSQAQFAAQGFYAVRELTLDPAGVLYVNATCPFVATVRFCLLAIAADGTVSKRPTDPPLGGKFFPYLGLAVDAVANVFAGYRNTIVRLTPAGAQTRLAGDDNVEALAQPARVDRFRDPGGLVLDGAGNLLIADTGNSTIKLLLP